MAGGFFFTGLPSNMAVLLVTPCISENTEQCAVNFNNESNAHRTGKAAVTKLCSIESYLQMNTMKYKIQFERF